MESADKYFTYLRRRSRLGYLYRSKILYPTLGRFLSGRTLDIGCGLGDFLASTPRAVGVDVNPKAVEFCTGRGLDARLMQPDILPFDDNVFDSAVLDNVLEHISMPQPLLTEIARVLGPRGVLIVGVPGELGFRSDPDHKVFYSRKSLRATLECAGFERVRSFAMPLPFRFLTRHVRSYCEYGVFRKKGTPCSSGTT